MEEGGWLLDLVEEELGIDRKEVLSRKRNPYIIDARRIISVCLVRHTKYKLNHIGRFLGGLDHSSIIYYRDTHEDLMETDYEFRKKFSKVHSRFELYITAGLPVEKKLKNLLKERDAINSEIRRVRKLVKIKESLE
jgi:hypothetical protein